MRTAHSESERDSAYRWVILLLEILAWATSNFARLNYAGIQNFIAADLHLDKGQLGLLGSVFFYSYAVFQMPWGIASDRFGSRSMTAFGIFLTAATMVGFSEARSQAGLLFWRAASGVAGAAVYAPMAGSIARWFPPRQSGLSQALFGGLGGALGESVAFFVLPVVSIYFASGWRQGTVIIAVIVAATGALCAVFLQSAPERQQATTKNPFDWKLLGDLRLWSYTFLWSGFVVGIRGAQTWIAIYVADVSIANHGRTVNDAVVQAGVFTVVTYSLLGRGVGVPLGGKLSDILVKRGISRMMLALMWLALATVLFFVLSRGVTGIWTLGIIAAFLGTAVNLFTLITSAVSETYGPARTASIVSFINTVGQVAGATALAVSGYFGMALSAQPGNSLDEYRGVWLAGMAGVLIMTILGGVAALVGAARSVKQAPHDAA